MSDTHVREELLQAYVDGEPASAEEESRIRAHLTSCWTCRTRYEELLHTVGEFVRWRDAELARRGASSPEWPDITGALQSNAPKRKPESARMRGLLPRLYSRNLRVLAAALGAATLLFAVAILPSLWRGPDEPPRPAVTRPEPNPVPMLPTPPPRLPAPPSLTNEPNDASIALQIASALRRSRADLGEPVEVTRLARGHYRIEMLGLGDGRTSELRSALHGIPGVELKVTNPVLQVLPPGEVEALASESNTPRPAIQALLRNTLGSASAIQTYTNAALDYADAITVRVHAIRKLAALVPVEGLERDELQVRASILNDHERELKRNAGRLAAHLQSVFGGAGTDCGAAERTKAAERIDFLVNALLAGADSDLRDEEITGALMACLEWIGR